MPTYRLCCWGQSQPGIWETVYGPHVQETQAANLAAAMPALEQEARSLKNGHQKVLAVVLEDGELCHRFEV